MSAFLKSIWRKWAGPVGLSLQAIVALLILGFVTGQELGLIGPVPNTLPLSQTARFVVTQVSFFALVAALGICRKRWWAYFLEAGLIASMLIAASNIEMPFQHNWMIYLPYDVPIAQMLNGIFGWIFLGSLAVELTKSVYRHCLEERSFKRQVPLQATTR